MSTIRTLLFAVFVIGTQQAQGQTSSLNVGVNYAMRLQSAKANIRMPEYIGASVGYELSIIQPFSVEFGLAVGQYSQTVGYKEYQHTRCALRGFALSPFVAPTFYVPLGSWDNMLLLRNELAYAFQKLTRNDNKEEVFNTFECPKSQFAYQVGVGYRHMFSENVSMTAIVNYSTFNFLRGSDGKGFKTSTPFSMIIKFGWHF